MTATVGTPTVAARRPRRLELRHLWIVPGLTAAVIANTVATDHGIGLVPILVFGILPHVPALGFGRLGGWAAEAAWLFNRLHEPSVPVLLTVLGLAGVVGPMGLVAGLTWIGHILFDRGLGDGRRNADGSRHRPAGR